MKLVMKYKKDIIGVVIFLALALPTFEPNYSPTQVILSTIFTYLGIRLCFYVYFQKNQILSKQRKKKYKRY